MSRIKPQKSCKICDLIHTHKDLWVEVHDRILKESEKKAHVCRWLNKKGELINANRKDGTPEFPKFYPANFTAHFNKHVSDLKKMKAELRAAMKDAPRAADGFSSAELGEMAGVLEAEQEATAESFKDYPEIIQKIENVIMQDLVAKNGLLDPNSQLKSKDRIADEKIKLLNNLITIKRNLADVQRTEQIGGSAVRHSMLRLGEEVVSGVNKLATELRETLKQQFPESSLPDDVQKMLLSRVVEIIKGVYPEILAEVFKLYGIK